jgi:hypothetical protein
MRRRILSRSIDSFLNPAMEIAARMLPNRPTPRRKPGRPLRTLEKDRDFKILRKLG